MIKISNLSILPFADIAEAAPGSQRATPFTSQWTPEAMAMLARLAGGGFRVEAIQPAMAAAFGLAMTIDAVRRKGRRMEVFGPSPRKGYVRPTRATGNGWSDANVTLLRELVALGQTSREIAAQIMNAAGQPMSPNAVLSKAIRMGIGIACAANRMPVRVATARLPVVKFVKVAKVKLPKQPKPAPAPILTMRDVLANAQIVAPVETRFECAPVGLMDLAHDGCRFPLGDPRAPGFGFCGERQQPAKIAFGGVVAKRSSYCSHHHALAWFPGKQRVQGAHRVRA